MKFFQRGGVCNINQYLRTQDDVSRKPKSI